MQKHIKKSQMVAGYCHPLVDDIRIRREEPEGEIIASYVPFVGRSQNRISAKIARCSLLPNSGGKEMVVGIQPFGCGVEEVGGKEGIGECSSCGGKVNPKSRIQNHKWLACSFCGKLTELKSVQLLSSQNWCYKYSKKDEELQTKQSISQETKKCIKRVLFAIEASEYMHNSKIVNGIFDCLSALQDEDIQVGFVLFDDCWMIFINPSTLEVTKVMGSEAGQLPLALGDMFGSMKEDFEAVEEVVRYLLYQAYFISQNIVGDVSKKVFGLLPEDIQIKVFVTTLSRKQSEGKQSEGNVKGVFANMTNKIQGKEVKIKSKNKKAKFTKFQVGGNTQYYIIPYNIGVREAVECLGYGISKIYNPKQLNQVQKEIYYDLYDSILKDVNIDVTFTIRTVKQIELVLGNNNYDTVFGNVKLISSVKKDTNEYKVKVKRCEPSIYLSLHFKSDSTLKDSLVQIQYRNKYGQGVVMNISPFQCPEEEELLQYDDELIFNHHLRLSLKEWQASGHQKYFKDILKKHVYSTISFLKQFITGQTITLPNNWKHYLLYSFCIEQFLNKKLIDEYQILGYVKCNLEMFSKRMYFRTYCIDDEGILKNLKFNACVFRKNSVVFTENGEYIFMVMNQPSVEEVKNIFGGFDSIPSLSRIFPELPQLQSNIQYRQAVERIRDSHEHGFLPLKIIDYQSYLFTDLVEPYLYPKEDHLAYMRKTWRYA